VKAIYRIGTRGQSINVEHWESWEAFDAQRPRPILAGADLAYSIGEVIFESSPDHGFEIQRIEVNNGRGMTAKALIEADLPVLRDLGARVVGVFEIVHGERLPAFLLILEWRDADQAAQAMRALEADAGMIERRRADRQSTGRASIRGVCRQIACALSYTSYG
jgi:hypothetical protein